jgi:short/branched chain acyl-CoA dehydrogenase
VIVVAVTGEKNGKPIHSLFVVPRNTPGYDVGPKIHTIGWKASESRELFFDNARVPAENLIGVEGDGLKQILSSLNSGRIAIAAICLGLAQGAYDRAAKYAKERIAFGKPISQYQGISFKLVDMATRIQAGRWLVYHAAHLADQGKSYRTEASMAKLFCSETAFDAARDAIQIHGSYGLSIEYSVSKLLGDAKVLEIVEGTSEIQRVLLGRLLEL